MTYSYENLASRMNRLRGNSASHGLKNSASGYLSYTAPDNSFISRPTSSCYRSTLKVQSPVNMLNDLSNCQVGRVAKNTGIRKYNQRQIKDVLNTYKNKNTREYVPRYPYEDGLKSENRWNFE